MGGERGEASGSSQRQKTTPGIARVSWLEPEWLGDGKGHRDLLAHKKFKVPQLSCPQSAHRHTASPRYGLQCHRPDYKKSIPWNGGSRFSGHNNLPKIRKPVILIGPRFASRFWENPRKIAEEWPVTCLCSFPTGLLSTMFRYLL